MNRKEFLESGGYSTYSHKVTKLLKQWKLKNNITERCVAHHRDDTEECRKYNKEHYELFGFEIDENGNLKFEEGKYVQFMTLKEHNIHHNKGKTPSDKTKEKIRIANTGKKRSEETKEKIRIVNIGKKHSEETRAKMSKNSSHYWKGKKLSKETRTKLSLALQGDKNPNYGKHRSDDTKSKISAANKGRIRTDEFRTKISAANKGKVLSDEHRSKLSASRKVHFAGIKILFTAYKNNGGDKKWNEFQRAISNGDITFQLQPISVYL